VNIATFLFLGFSPGVTMAQFGLLADNTTGYEYLDLETKFSTTGLSTKGSDYLISTTEGTGSTVIVQ
jgi:hypothetical protein